jgi:hypothetical protein
MLFQTSSFRVSAMETFCHTTWGLTSSRPTSIFVVPFASLHLSPAFSTTAAMYQIQYYPFVAGYQQSEVPVQHSYQYSQPATGATAYPPQGQSQFVYQSNPFNTPWYSYPQPQFQSYVQATPYPQYSQSYSQYNPQYYHPPPNSSPTAQIPVQTSNYSPPVDYVAPSPTVSKSTSAIPTAHTDMLRGPPRKPKQSGHALWVGNLPLDVELEEMRDFFAMDGLESIFLIRKSNCAFVNYTTERAALDALAAFNQKGTPPFD